tara:strand:- start:128 stop:349 length:222 start_codon:yes stop_codon:yes gene_type:complete
MKQQKLFETEDKFGEDIYAGPKFKKEELTTKEKLIDPKDQTKTINSSWSNLGNHILLTMFTATIIWVIWISYQ